MREPPDPVTIRIEAIRAANLRLGPCGHTTPHRSAIDDLLEQAERIEAWLAEGTQDSEVQA